MSEVMSRRVRVVDNLSEACEHIKALHEYCKEHSLEVDACGDTPWVTCRKCGVELEHASLGSERVERKRVVRPRPEVPF